MYLSFFQATAICNAYFLNQININLLFGGSDIFEFTHFERILRLMAKRICHLAITIENEILKLNCLYIFFS